MVAQFWNRSALLMLLCCSSLASSIMPLTLMQREKAILDDILNTTSYDTRIRPLKNRADISPTIVEVNTYVLMMNRIDDVKMQYNVQLYLRQNWTDERLRYDDLGGKMNNLKLFDISKVWTPDLFFVNERSGYINNLIKPNTFVRISPSGSVLYSARISLFLSCPMNFAWYPFDQQICSITMESYGYNAEDVVFKWKGSDPVVMAKNNVLNHYTMKKLETSYCSVKLMQAEYSCLRVDFFFTRNLNYSMNQIFIPSIMLVMISWVSFWLDHHAIITRLMLVLGSLLATVVQVSGNNANLASVSYTRSIDVWTGTCLTFIFAALMELAIIDYRWRSLAKKQRRAAGTLDTTADEENDSAFDMPLVNNQADNTNQSRTHHNGFSEVGNFYYRWVSRLPTGPKRLDILSRYLFPIGFAFFNIFYWFINLVQYAVN